MMRIAAIAATECGIEICAPVHDAFLISAPFDCLQDHVDRAAGTLAVGAEGRPVTGARENDGWAFMRKGAQATNDIVSPAELRRDYPDLVKADGRDTLRVLER